MITSILLALALAAQVAPPPDDPAVSLEALQQIYDQSCAAREYGAYDDVCDQLKTQIRTTRAEQEREARRRAAHTPAKPTAEPSSTSARPAQIPATPSAPPG